MPLRRLVTTVLLSAALLIVASCGNDSGTVGGGRAGQPNNRPTTTAHLAIVQPTPNAAVGPSVTVQLQLTGGTLAPVSGNTQLVANQGHIHLYVDDQLITMSPSLTQTLPAQSPGLHHVRAEFVANDHLPWANRSQVTADVLFTVS